jgi:hypothetical protein
MQELQNWVLCQTEPFIISFKTYQSGDSISTYSLFKGAAADDVKYIPRMSNAILARKSFGEGPRNVIASSPMPEITYVKQ